MTDITAMTDEQRATFRAELSARADGWYSAFHTSPNDPDRWLFYERMVNCNDVLKQIDRYEAPQLLHIPANTPGSIREAHADNCLCVMCAAYRRTVIRRASRVEARNAA